MFRHQVELIGYGKIDVPPSVAKELGQFRLDGLQKYNLGTDKPKQGARALCGPPCGSANELR
jgi:hypothetical protein